MNCYILTTVPTNTNTLFSNKSTQFMNDRQKRTVINQHKCCEKTARVPKNVCKTFSATFSRIIWGCLFISFSLLRAHF